MPLRAKDSVLIASSDEQETATWVNYLTLESSPFLVNAAQTSLMVFQHLEQASRLPALIILDMKLAKVDNFSLLKQLKSTPGYQVIPIIILADLPDTENINTCYELQVNACLVRPASESELKMLIEKTKKFWLVVSASPVSGTRYN